MSKKINRRKTYLIYPKFQLKLVAINMVSTLFVLGILFVAVKGGFYKTSQAGIGAGLPANHDFFAFVNGQEIYFIRIFIWAALLSLVITFISNVLVSFKVVGPLYRLKMYFAGLKNGSPKTDLVFRKKDCLHELADNINGYLRRIKK